MKRLEFIRKSPLALIGLLFIPMFKNTENKNRRVEYYEDGWKNIDFENIKKDMYIQMFEPDGAPVVMGWKNKKPIYGALVIKSPYQHKGVLTINIKIL